MPKIFTKRNGKEIALFQEVSYNGARKEVATGTICNGYVTATIDNGSETFRSETMTGLKAQVAEYIVEMDNKMTRVQNLMTAEYVMIPTSAVGGVNDPSTERYFTM